MVILSHRGFWVDEADKNSIDAFRRSFSLGIGVETDIRDCNGSLVISHDPPSGNCITLETFLQVYIEYPSKPKLALNIKSDGLQSELKKQLTTFCVDNYFVFDMAVPDSLQYLNSGMSFYTRQSEFELIPPLYDEAQGVWLDEFNGHWLNDGLIKRHLKALKSICIVSPELHGRTYETEWVHYRELEKHIGKDKLMLCTDFPQYAKEFFNA